MDWIVKWRNQTQIRTRQILLEFYPPVQKVKQICVTGLRTSGLHEKVIVIRIFLSKFLQTWQEVSG
jgi:hypothetical protein